MPGCRRATVEASVKSGRRGRWEEIQSDLRQLYTDSGVLGYLWDQGRGGDTKTSQEVW